jgi:transposase-like protein
MVAFCDFPEAHWQYLRTTSVIESPFTAMKLRTTAAKRYKKVENFIGIRFRVKMFAQRVQCR